MNARRIALGILCSVCMVTALGLPKSTAQGQVNTCWILHPDMTFSASDCSSYKLLFSWAAGTRGLVNSYKLASQITLTVTGPGNLSLQYKSWQSRRFWQPIYPISPADFGWECPMANIWILDWTALLGNELAPGDYTVTVQNDLKFPVVDGLARCSEDGVLFGKTVYRGLNEFEANFSVK